MKKDELKAAERLCKIYFDIAAEILGEDEVRKRRDAAIDAEIQKSLADARKTKEYAEEGAELNY